MARISGYQLFVLTVLFQFGSTIVFGFASTSGRDAWFTSLLSALFGSGLLALYVTLMRLQPGLTLVEWFPAQFGRWIGTLVAWLYPLAFLYVAGRVLRDFGDLLATTMLNRTPFWVIELLYLLLIAYGLVYGIDNIARVGEMLFPVVILLLMLIEAVLLFSSNILEIDRLLPVLERGLLPELKKIWPLNVTVPYGETIVFTMFWVAVQNRNQIMKITLAATLFYALAIAAADAFAVATLGEKMFKTSTYPLMVLMRQIEMGEFIEHLDAVILIQGIAIGFFKISLFMLGAICGIKKLTGLRNEHWLVLPVTLVVLLLSIFMAPNVGAHMKVGLQTVPKLLWVPLFIVLPSLLLLTIGLRRLFAKREST